MYRNTNATIFAPKRFSLSLCFTHTPTWVLLVSFIHNHTHSLSIWYKGRHTYTFSLSLTHSHTVSSKEDSISFTHAKYLLSYSFTLQRHTVQYFVEHASHELISIDPAICFVAKCWRRRKKIKSKLVFLRNVKWTRRKFSEEHNRSSKMAMIITYLSIST